MQTRLMTPCERAGARGRRPAAARVRAFTGGHDVGKYRDCLVNPRGWLSRSMRVEVAYYSA
jgi:hypothetical protein